MIVKCGTDIIEINRIRESIETMGEKFLNRVFTEKEISYCESKKSQKYQHYAARFAAKEAIFKAISESLKNKYEIGWQDIEIENREDGKPKVKIQKMNQEKMVNIDLSISHCREFAIANVVALYQ